MLVDSCEHPWRRLVATADESAPSALIVDDDEHFRSLARCLLAPCFEIQEAASVAECARLLRGEMFDAVILDIVMPDRDGIEAISEIKRLKPEAKIVAVSGAGNSELYLKVAERLGAHASLAKTSIEALRELLEVVLDSGRR